MNRPDPRNYIEPLRPGLIPIPAIQPGVCSICRTGVSEGFEDCRSCEEHQHRPGVQVLAVSMSAHGELLHHHLRRYKDGSAYERRAFTRRLAALVELFLQHHLDCLGGPASQVATVPSTYRDAPRAIVNQLHRFKGLANPLECRIEPDNFRSFITTRSIAGQRVLLLDDTFTSGKSIFKAYRVLEEAGAQVVGPLVIGRHFHPESSDWPNHRKLMRCLGKVPWSVEACGICQPVDCPGLRPSPTLGLS